MGLFEFFWEMEQNRRIDDAISGANRAKSETQISALNVAKLEGTIDRLTLINRALWEFVQAHMQLTEQDLVEKVNEIDLRDGVRDGKCAMKKSQRCQGCGRVLNGRHQRCIYCGALLGSGNVFDSVM